MTALLSSFRLIDLASQAAAVQSALRGLPIEGKLAWLAERGTLTTTRSAGWGAETFRFESRIGMSCVFFFRGDRIVLIRRQHDLVAGPRRAEPAEGAAA